MSHSSIFTFLYRPSSIYFSVYTAGMLQFPHCRINKYILVIKTIQKVLSGSAIWGSQLNTADVGDLGKRCFTLILWFPAGLSGGICFADCFLAPLQGRGCPSWPKRPAWCPAAQHEHKKRAGATVPSGLCSRTFSARAAQHKHATRQAATGLHHI